MLELKQLASKQLKRTTWFNVTRLSNILEIAVMFWVESVTCAFEEVLPIRQMKITKNALLNFFNENILIVWLDFKFNT
jgi:hypothetical protein